jgi:Ni/Co efflux regulator RcnB
MKKRRSAMFMQSKIMTRFITIIFLGLFTVASVLVPDNSFADKRGKRVGKSHRVDRRGDGSHARRKGRRHVVSPRTFRRGHVVQRLPRGYRRTWYKKEPYYYYGGIFYRPASSGFIVVEPPIGSVIVSLPVGYTRIWIGGEGYYSYGGVFYRRMPSGYVVVEPPADVVVEEETPNIVQPTEPAAGKVSVATSVLNVRTGPGLSYDVIYQIQEGYILEIHGRELGWLYVQLPNGEFGWVMKGFTSPMGPPASG